MPLDNSRIIISNENEGSARNRIDFPLEKRTIFNKVKGKLNLIVHFISSVESLNSITDLSLPPVVASTSRRSRSFFNATPAQAAITASTSTTPKEPSAPALVEEEQGTITDLESTVEEPTTVSFMIVYFKNQIFKFNNRKSRIKNEIELKMKTLF